MTYNDVVAHPLRVAIRKRAFDGTKISCLISDAETRRKVEPQYEDTVNIDAVHEQVLRLRGEGAVR